LFGAIGLVGMVVILLLAVRIEYATRTPLDRAGNASRSAGVRLETFTRNAEAIHAMGMMPHLQRLWLRDHDGGVAAHAAASDRSAVLNAIAKQVRVLLQLAILGCGAWLVLDNDVSAGVMIAASIIMSRALAPAEVAIGQWRNFAGARA